MIEYVRIEQLPVQCALVPILHTFKLGTAGEFDDHVLHLPEEYETEVRVSIHHMNSAMAKKKFSLPLLKCQHQFWRTLTVTAAPGVVVQSTRRKRATTVSSIRATPEAFTVEELMTPGVAPPKLMEV